MKIERFRIQGFKSIGDVTVEGLSDINVFYGLNDVGKSNIFQALALWRWVMLTEKKPRSNVIPLKQLEAEFGSYVFPLAGDKIIELEIDCILKSSEFSVNLIKGPAPSFDNVKVTYKIVLKLLPNTPNNIEYRIDEIKPHDDDGFSFDVEIQSYPFLNFDIIQATRRFQIEKYEDDSDEQYVSHHNLKRSLFYAYLSRNFEQRQRLAATKKILTDPPFSLGELDVALNPATNQIDIGFVRPNGRLPLENIGSGSQQLLLILGEIFLNDYPIIALEEPEMNLSPQYQQYLLVALRKLMQDPAVKLQQLFISTHSPYLEFEENFFDVTMDKKGQTQVARLPVEKRNRYFPGAQIGEQSGGRINSFNQVELYDEMMKDLNLQRGDLIMFIRNKAGRWEVRPEKDVIREVETVFNGDKTQ